MKAPNADLELSRHVVVELLMSDDKHSKQKRNREQRELNRVSLLLSRYISCQIASSQYMRVLNVMDGMSFPSEVLAHLVYNMYHSSIKTIAGAI